MERVNRILKSQKYQEHIDKIKAAEEGRIFCCHNMGHFLDVARIAALINEEEQLGIEKELIYATALLHDIGRHVQYANGTPHEQASAQLAPELLGESGFDEWEQKEILRAIREHRNAEIVKEKSLAGIIYRADKTSRACFACDAEKMCDWKKEKKNMEIRY
ncbi:MAG: HD domain-containing protein [Lachnospiraceae bacterium]|nr:HD domain-containing protein [Lachnospiraceae bacterium]